MEPQLTRYWFGAQAYSHVQGPPLTNPLQSQVCAPSDAHEHVSPAGSWQSTWVRDARHPPAPASFRAAAQLHWTPTRLPVLLVELPEQAANPRVNTTSDSALLM